MSTGLLEDRFFALSVDLLCIASVDGYFKRLNPAWEHTLGYTTAELLARPAIEIVHPDDRDVARAHVGTLQTESDVVHFENRYLCKDGSFRWIAWSVSAVRSVGLFYAIGRDITQHRNAEEQLKRKTAELEAVFKALPDLMFHTDVSGKIIDYTAGRASDLYVPPETFLGKTFADVLPPEVAMMFTDAMKQAHQTNHTASFEYELAVPAGQQRFEARVVPFLDGRTIIVVRNVTDRWQAQQALKVSEERLRESERLEATGRLAGGIAHDFNNLMMVVLLHSDALLKKPEVWPYRQQLLDIRGAGERAADLTGQLLAFARKQILSATVLDPAAVVRDMQGMLRRLIGEHIELVSDPAVGIGNVRADRGQFEQVVLNLALNARDAMSHGGTLAIVLANVEVGEAEARQLELPHVGSYVQLTVTDTGPGIDPETRPHIFEPFFTTKGVGRGTGLGLATVYGIVRQSGGAVAVDTAPGKGTSFRVLLPRAVEAPSRTSTRDKFEPVGTETIMIVEDEAAVRGALGEALRRLGYHTIEAENAERAVEIAKSHDSTIHLLLTDVVMPGLSGYELASQFLAARPGARLIYMTGYPLGQRASDWPDAPVLQKPFQPHKLAQAVREALDAVTSAP